MNTAIRDNGNEVCHNSSVTPIKNSFAVVFFGLGWLAVVAVGMIKMLAYAYASGEAGAPPGVWPKASMVAPASDKPTLLMFIHPQCPCSRASIGELALLMAHCQGAVQARVLFLQPQEMPSNWSQGELWRDAMRIPGVIVQRDPGGNEARRFHIETSGDTTLYDASGHLLFHGGMTASRGHSGDNVGRDNLEALLRGQPVQITETPAFGCSLFGCKPDQTD